MSAFSPYLAPAFLKKENASTIQFVGISAFHTRISDPLIGGTYMTVSIMISAVSARVLIRTASQYVHEPGRYLAKVFCSERLVYNHH